jgi:hypothetical protein
MEEALKLQFEQIFVKHYERLANSKQSAGGLPFTLENIVCFILFGGRELDIEDVYGDVSERYSLSTFLADARDAGIQDDVHLQKALHDLIAQKFIHEQPDGHYYSYQATRETARMLNRVYPKMQGLSMLAYIGQTIQEVESSRIDLESALSRFDQTLQKQGVPLPKPKIPVIAAPPKPAVAPQKVEENKHSNSRIFRDYVVSPAATKAIPEKYATQDTVPLAPAVEMPQQANAEAVRETTGPDKDIDIEPALSPATPALAEFQETEPVLKEQTTRQTIEEDVVVDDDEIAAKIAAFEKELSLVCPICKTNALKEEKTVAGKLFYSCTSDNCNFISWGRPHQIPCARCKNPFLVEVADSEGRMILKCPRATCQHRQSLTPQAGPVGPAGGVKTVVRKRLVRRKV